MSEDDDEEFVDRPIPVDGLEEAEYGSRRLETPSIQRAREFLPWHRPRKQFVRRMWKGCLEDILKQREPDSEISYLGLPGADLLDLRFFYRHFCEDGENRLRFVGFDTARQAGSSAANDLELSLAELKLRPSVSSQSDVLADDIRRLAATNSQSYRRCARSAPFDVVNLDLCDSILSEAPGGPNSMFSALARIVGVQAGYTHPWLILLTSTIDRESADADAVDALVEGLRCALDECDGLDEELDELLESSIDTPLEAMSDADFGVVMTVGICWWISVLVAETDPGASASMRASLAYTNDPRSTTCDMVSLAVRVSQSAKAPFVDPVGLAMNEDAAVDDLDECEVIARILSKQAVRTNVDEAAAEPHVQDDLIEEISGLMEDARYDRELFIEWASK